MHKKNLCSSPPLSSRFQPIWFGKPDSNAADGSFKPSRRRFVFFIDRHNFGKPIFDLPDPALVAGVGRKKLGRFSTAGLHHPIPKRHRSPRILTRLGHQVKPDMIRLRFMLAAEGQQDTVFRADPEGPLDRIGRLRITFTEDKGGAGLGDLGQHAL